MITSINIEAETAYFIGDIHGNFSCIHNFIKRYDIQSSVLFFCGDCGLGFEKTDYYKTQIFPKLSRLLSKTNNYIIFIRGNHDDPAIFKTFMFNYGRIKAVPDYTVVRVANNGSSKNVLCIGGAISVDRSYRLKLMNDNIIKYTKYHHCSFDEAKRNIKRIYWSDDNCYYDKGKLEELNMTNILIDIVATHTCPDFCQPLTKEGIAYWITNEKSSDIEELKEKDLAKELNDERRIMTDICNNLKENGNSVKYWFYGHFHFHKFEEIDGTKYYLLDMERNGNVDAVNIEI